MEEMRKSQIPIKKLYRSRDDRIIFGICGGIGKYFEIDSWIIRIFFIIFLFFNIFGLILYLFLMILIPPEKGLEEESKKEELREFIYETKRRKNIKIFLGLIMIIIGLFYILRIYFPASFSYLLNWRVLLPYVIIISGLYIIFRSTNIK